MQNEVPEFTESDVQRWFSPETMEKARGYRGLVRDVQVAPNYLRATVVGSAKTPYKNAHLSEFNCAVACSRDVNSTPREYHWAINRPKQAPVPKRINSNATIKAVRVGLMTSSDEPTKNQLKNDGAVARYKNIITLSQRLLSLHQPKRILFK